MSEDGLGSASDWRAYLCRGFKGKCAISTKTVVCFERKNLSTTRLELCGCGDGSGGGGAGGLCVFIDIYGLRTVPVHAIQILLDGQTCIFL